MNDISPRKATLLDLMIFTAATAVGLALARYYVTTPISLTPDVDGQGFLFFVPGYPTHDLRWWATLASIFLAVWSITLLLLRLRSPRPKLVGMILGSGFLIPAFATVTVLTFAVEELVSVHRYGWQHFEVPASWGSQKLTGYLDTLPSWIFPRLRTSLAFPASCALLVSVPLYCLRIKGDWIDRLGLALGLAWVVVYFL